MLYSTASIEGKTLAISASSAITLHVSKVNFQPVNAGRGAHQPLEKNRPDSLFLSVGLAIPPCQQACYLPSIAGTHFYTWVERSDYSKVLYSRTQHVDRNESSNPHPSVYEPSTDPLDNMCPPFHDNPMVITM